MSRDRERVRDGAVARQRERAAAVERIVAETEALLDHKYPTRTDEVAALYGVDPGDLPNETEALPTAVDRLLEEGYGRAVRLARDDAPRTPTFDGDG